MMALRRRVERTAARQAYPDRAKATDPWVPILAPAVSRQPLGQPSTAPCRSKSARLDLGCRPSWPSVPGDDQLPAGCSTRPQNPVGRTKELNLQNKAKLKTESRKFKTQRKHRTHHRILPTASSPPPPPPPHGRV